MSDRGFMQGTSHEHTVLLNLGHEIVNFRAGFPRSKLKHTFVLTPYGSGMFGLMPQSEKLYMGIPRRLYDTFKMPRWKYAARVKNQPGLFLVMQIGDEKSSPLAGLRIFIRSKRLSAMDESIKQLRVVPMSKEGISREDDLLMGFNIPFRILDDFEWERVTDGGGDDW